MAGRLPVGGVEGQAPRPCAGRSNSRDALPVSRLLRGQPRVPLEYGAPGSAEGEGEPLALAAERHRSGQSSGKGRRARTGSGFQRPILNQARKGAKVTPAKPRASRAKRSSAPCPSGVVIARWAIHKAFPAKGEARTGACAGAREPLAKERELHPEGLALLILQVRREIPPLGAKAGLTRDRPEIERTAGPGRAQSHPPTHPARTLPQAQLERRPSR